MQNIIARGFHTVYGYARNIEKTEAHLTALSSVIHVEEHREKFAS